MDFLIELFRDSLLKWKQQKVIACNLHYVLTPLIESVSYTVTMLTVLHNKQSFHSEYNLLLERPYDAVAHLAALRSSYFNLGMDIEMMGNYMMKVYTPKGYTLYTIEPTKPKTNILLNTN